MAITGDCGPHCGLRFNAEGTVRIEGHCDCTGCHDGAAPIIVTRGGLLTSGPGVPMCNRWYERAGGYRPWQRAPRTIRDATLVGTADIRPDAVSYRDSPPSTLAEPPEDVP
jgi:hypothetical protein